VGLVIRLEFLEKLILEKSLFGIIKNVKL